MTSVDSSVNFDAHNKKRLLDTDIKESQLRFELNSESVFEDQGLHGLMDPLTCLVVASGEDCQDSKLMEANAQPTQVSQVVEPIPKPPPMQPKGIFILT